MKTRLLIILFCFLIALFFLFLVFISYVIRTRAEEKAQKEKIKNQNEIYKKELKENEKIINSIDSTNAVSKLHELAQKGKQRQN